MTTDYVFHPHITSDAQELIAAVLAVALDSSQAELLSDLRNQHQPVQAWLAYAEGQLVGCKLGYERKPGHYYSWLGGVHPEFRGRGIAAELMRQQHAWCIKEAYQAVRTHTYNRWRAMLLLNLRHGFDIIGTVQGGRGLTLVLEKELRGAIAAP